MTDIGLYEAMSTLRAVRRLRTDPIPDEVLDRLRAEVTAGRPIIGAGAGTGLSAKCAEAGGVDLIIIYNSGRYRLARIYRGDNTVPGYRAPLAQPGLKVAAGDYVLTEIGAERPSNIVPLQPGSHP